MKRFALVFILSLILFVAPSCKTSTTDTNINDLNKNNFYDKVSVPEKLKLEIDFDQPNNPIMAKTYIAQHIELDKEKLIETFIQGKITEEKIWAEGPQISAVNKDTSEVLSIFDGGKSFGTKTGMEGGFSYFTLIGLDDPEKWNVVANTSFSDPSPNENYKNNSDYGSYVNLDFESLQNTEKNILSLFSKSDIPNFRIDETYSLDLATMTNHYKLYLNSGMAEEENTSKNWSHEDECYIISMEQIIDNIPIINKVWQMPDGTKGSAWGNPMPSTTMKIVYDKSGIRKIMAYNLLRTGEKIEDNKLISFFDAIKILVDDYSKILIEDDIRIVSAKLCYLNIPQDSTLRLVPGWLFTSAKSRTFEGITYTQYKYDVVNAITGNLYQDRW